MSILLSTVLGDQIRATAITLPEVEHADGLRASGARYCNARWIVERRIETCVIYQCSSLRIRYDQSDTVVISIIVQKLKG